MSDIPQQQDNGVRVKKKIHAARECDMIPPELAEEIRQFMRREWQRLRRDELFYLRRGMMSEVESIDRELGLESE